MNPREAGLTRRRGTRECAGEGDKPERRRSGKTNPTELTNKDKPPSGGFFVGAKRDEDLNPREAPEENKQPQNVVC